LFFLLERRWKGENVELIVEKVDCLHSQSGRLPEARTIEWGRGKLFRIKGPGRILQWRAADYADGLRHRLADSDNEDEIEDCHVADAKVNDSNASSFG